MVYFRGNHPQMAELFRLMKHSNLPRCIMIGIVHDWIMIIQWTHYWTIVQVSRFFVFGENTFFFRSAEFPELFFFWKINSGKPPLPGFFLWILGWKPGFCDPSLSKSQSSHQATRWGPRLRDRRQWEIKCLGWHFAYTSITGWWFGTWLLLFHILGIIIPTD